MRRLVAVLVLGAATACSSGAADAPAPPSRTAEDVRMLVERMEGLHPNLFHDVSRARFRGAAEELARRAPELAPDALLVELMRLTALVGARDGHTGLFPLDTGHRRELHVYPLRLYDFTEGLYVVAEVGRLGLVGARLVSIAGRPVDEVAALVRPLVPRDNEWSRRARLPSFIAVAEVLHGLGVTSDARSASFELELPGGARREVTLEPVPVTRYLEAFADVFDPRVPIGLPSRPAPAYLARRNRPWWLARLGGGRVLYLAYNAVVFETSPLAERLVRLARDPRVRRVVVDLRHNPGGEVPTSAALARALQRPLFGGRLVLLTSRTTFSAATMFATELDRTTSARFVGEPTGGSPNLWAETFPIALPESGWTVHVATAFHERGGPRDRRLAIAPDLRVDLTAADFFAGRDPVLAAALALR